MRLPFTASLTEILLGETGQASPNSVDSKSVASGRRSPIWILMRSPIPQHEGGAIRHARRGYGVRYAEIGDDRKLVPLAHVGGRSERPFVVNENDCSPLPFGTA